MFTQETFMSWQDEQPPWGKKKGPASPEDLVAALLKKLKDSFSDGGKGGDGAPKGSGSGAGKPPIVGMALIALLVGLFIVVQSSFYQVDAGKGEKGIVLRLGKFYTLTDPGLHFKMPFLDEVRIVEVDKIRNEQFGFRSRSQAQKSTFNKSAFADESLMLTGDKNVIDVEWIVQYRVQDPYKFAFNVYNVPKAVRDVSEMVMRRIVGNHGFDYILNNRDVLIVTASREIQATLNRYNSGVHIAEVRLQDVTPPDRVKPAFNEVNEADQDMRRLVNEAEREYNNVIPKASGDANKLLEQAHGYAIERVNNAKGETARFLSVLAEYKRSKAVTRKRLYLESMGTVLPKVKEIYVIDPEQKSLLPFLNVNPGQPVKR
jgi:membrane protease subunit HflK